MTHAGFVDESGDKNINVLFPDAANVRKLPDIVSDDQAWVNVVLNRVFRSPFSRIRSLAVDITEAVARAKGYITEAEKFDNTYKLLTRETAPQTIYVKQKLERDDVVDITDFDVCGICQTTHDGKTS